MALERTLRANAALASLMNDDTSNEELALAAEIYLEQTKSFVTQDEYEQLVKGIETALAPQDADDSGEK